MEKEFQVIEFESSPEGQLKKVKQIETLKKLGWIVEEEIITAVDFDAKAASRDTACACFFCGICAPFFIDANKHKKDSKIRVTLSRSYEEKAAAEKKAYEEKAAAENKDSELASIEAILSDYRKSDGSDKYISPKIVKSIIFYLENDRPSFAPLPSIQKSKREREFVVLRDKSGAFLAKYKILEINELPDIDF